MATRTADDASATMPPRSPPVTRMGGLPIEGNLPSGATYEIVGEAENGLPIVVRRRFSHWAPDTMRFKQMDMAEPLIALLATHHSAKTAVKGKSPLAARARPIETCVDSAEQK